MAVTRWLPFALIWITSAAWAELPAAQPGWVIKPTGHSYAALVEQVDAAVGASPLNVVTRASATLGAKTLGQTIPGNMVVGVFAPQFAIRLLDASVAAGIEAPLRLYLTENPDGAATLSYKTAAHVLAPYADEGGAVLTALATELDAILEQIAQQARRQLNVLTQTRHKAGWPFRQ
jgi:uncharacterized protein (DUF302 family)